MFLVEYYALSGPSLCIAVIIDCDQNFNCILRDEQSMIGYLEEESYLPEEIGYTGTYVNKCIFTDICGSG